MNNSLSSCLLVLTNKDIRIIRSDNSYLIQVRTMIGASSVMCMRGLHEDKLAKKHMIRIMMI